MSKLSEKLLERTSKPATRPALLVLEDGTAFAGAACGAPGEVTGEVCFNTSLEGYLEIVTDPSYAGQIVAMTYPQIGNYGVNRADMQALHPALHGLVVRDMCYTPSSWRSEGSLPDFLAREGVVAIEGVDTRALVRHVRKHGAMRAVLSTEDLNAVRLAKKALASEPIVGANLAKTVSCDEPYDFAATDLQNAKSFAFAEPTRPRYRVIAYDCGMKRSILEELARAGCQVQVVPWNTPAADVLAKAPDGVFLSNGPGDPNAVTETYEQVEILLGKVPLFGICLGHQMICKAVGGHMQKMKYGHHGGNQPVMNLLTGRVEVTAQNHGFSLAFPSLGGEQGNAAAESHCEYAPQRNSEPQRTHGPQREPAQQASCATQATRSAPVVANDRFGRIQLTHVNLNDGTPEGIAFLDIPAFSVQYHPEAGPGPTDSRYLFAAFTRLMDGRADYLNIDIAQERLNSWKF